MYVFVCRWMHVGGEYVHTCVYVCMYMCVWVWRVWRPEDSLRVHSP